VLRHIQSKQRERHPIIPIGIDESEDLDENRSRDMTYKLKLFVPVLMLVAVAALGQAARTIPEGTTIKVRTDTAIPAKPPANAKYTAAVSDDVLDQSGAVIVPRGARAQLVAQPTSDGKDTNLDLRSVSINGTRYLLTTQTSSSSSGSGLGANKRTA
jgi:hypothetical protein